MILLARIAIIAAILTTMWLNGSYAWSKALVLHHQIGQVAIAVTIDLAKCTLLALAAGLASRHYHLAAVLAFLLWWPCLAYSTFAGTSTLTATRTNVSAASDTQLAERARAQAAYDEATTDLATAKTSSLWKVSAACSNPSTTKQQGFCERVAKTRAVLAEADGVLQQTPLTTTDPEISLFATITGMDATRVTFAVVLLPALLLELLASVGSYVVSRSLRTNRPKPTHAPRTPTRWPWRRSSSVAVTAPVPVVPKPPATGNAAVATPSLPRMPFARGS